MEEKYNLEVLQGDLVRINKRIRLKSLTRKEELELLKSLSKLMTFLGDNLDEISREEHYLIKNSLLVYFEVMNDHAFFHNRKYPICREINQELVMLSNTVSSFIDHPCIKKIKFSDRYQKYL